MPYFNNNIKINEVSNTILYSNGLAVSSFIPHWQYNPIRSNIEIENIFIQQKVLSTYTRNTTEHTTTTEATVEGDTVIPINSEICIAKFTCGHNPSPNSNSELYIGLGQGSVQGGTTSLSGFFVVYREFDLFFEFYNINTLVFSFPITDWNGDNDAINYVQKNASNGILTFQIQWNKLSHQVLLFAVIDGVCHLLHTAPVIDKNLFPSYTAHMPYSFLAYFARTSFLLLYAELLVSPYTYVRETSIHAGILASPITGPAFATIPIVVIGTRFSDRQCVDILGWTVRQAVARNAVAGIVEYKQHLPAIYGTMSFGAYGTNLNIVAFQGTPPNIPLNPLDRFRAITNLPNNNINEYTSTNVIKNVCRISGAYSAETITGQRTYCALFYSHNPAGGSAYGNITIAEY